MDAELADSLVMTTGVVLVYIIVKFDDLLVDRTAV